jgi:hypothetical protein
MVPYWAHNGEAIMVVEDIALATDWILPSFKKILYQTQNRRSWTAQLKYKCVLKNMNKST